MLSCGNAHVAHRALDVEGARARSDRHFLAGLAEDDLLTGAAVHSDLAQRGARGDPDAGALVEIDGDVAHLAANLRRASCQAPARGEVAGLDGEVYRGGEICDPAAACKHLARDGPVNAFDAQRSRVEVCGQREVRIHPDDELPAPDVHAVDQGAPVAATEAEVVVLVQRALLDDHGVAVLALPIALATRTRRVLEGAGWNAGGAGRDAPAGLADSTDSRESRRAAPSSAEILPEATWLRISRLRSFMSQIRTGDLPVCQVPL